MFVVPPEAHQHESWTRLAILICQIISITIVQVELELQSLVKFTLRPKSGFLPSEQIDAIKDLHRVVVTVVRVLERCSKREEM